MQLLADHIYSKTSSPNILQNNLNSGILFLFHILVHILSVTAELTCHHCRGINCLRTNYEITQKCLNDLDICVNVFDGQTLIAQGCWEQLSEELRDKCGNDATIKNAEQLSACFKCNENLCNSLSSTSFECIICDSDIDKNCLSNPIDIKPSRCGISRTPNEYCFVKQEQYRVIRGCSYSMEDQMSCLSNVDCMICQPSELNACNNLETKMIDSGSESEHTEDQGSGSDSEDANERICHVCSGINCLRVNYEAKQKCLNSVDICVTVFEDETVLAQGCWDQLSEEVRSKCDDAKQCFKCNDNLCNAFASNSFKCLQCDSDNDVNCRTNPLDLVPLSCSVFRTPNAYCFVKQEGQHVTRGCSYTLVEQITCLSSDNCIICQPSEIDACNNIEVIKDNIGCDGDSDGGTSGETNGINAPTSGIEGGMDDNSSTEGGTSHNGEKPGDENSNIDSSNGNEGTSDSGNSGMHDAANNCDTNISKTLTILYALIVFILKQLFK